MSEMREGGWLYVIGSEMEGVGIVAEIDGGVFGECVPNGIVMMVNDSPS